MVKQLRTNERTLNEAGNQYRHEVLGKKTTERRRGGEHKRVSHARRDE